MSTLPGGRPSMVVTQVTVGIGATLVSAARDGRASISILNEGTTAVRYGPTSGVTVGNGALLPGILGASVTLGYCGDVWAIASAPQVVSVTEIYG